jgi:hypothetical protein
MEMMSKEAPIPEAASVVSGISQEQYSSNPATSTIQNIELQKVQSPVMENDLEKDPEQNPGNPLWRWVM